MLNQVREPIAGVKMALAAFVTITSGTLRERQLLCFAIGLWNHHDPILKERLFGLTGTQGNHGEDVKEYYFYLDSTPTHSYLKFLYKYPQTEYPYAHLVEENQRRSASQPEFELLDTGIFDGDRYFDVLVEYAKATPEDILIQIQVTNRGSESAQLDLLPTLWFRNTWSWDLAACWHLVMPQWANLSQEISCGAS
jgi:hypothetical protein